MGYLWTKIFQSVIGFNRVWAQTRTGGETPQGPGGTYTLPNPLGVENVIDIINNIAYYLSVYIAPAIVTLMILFAAFQILTAGDNPERLKTAKGIILWTCVGYGIILISWGITSIIENLLGAR